MKTTLKIKSPRMFKVFLSITINALIVLGIIFTMLYASWEKNYAKTDQTHVRQNH